MSVMHAQATHIPAPRRLRLTLLLSAGLLLFACAPAGSNDSEQTGPAFMHPGTAQMVHVLDSLYRSTLASPFEYYYLNTARAAAAKREISNYEGSQRDVLRSTIAIELLDAGKTEEAIAVFEEILAEIDGNQQLLTADARKYTDLLAISYLRLGEQQNCILNNTASSCILPFEDDAFHTLTRSSERAIEIYTRLLARYPGDYRARWLLNVAYMTLGRYPAGVPEQYLVPGLSRPAEPAIPPFVNVSDALGLTEERLAGSIAMEDFNNDGLLDLFVTAHRINDMIRLYLNDGNGNYVDHTEEAGLSRLAGGLNVVHADYNNDGYMDVLVLRGAWLGSRGNQPNSLLENKGDGTFEDVTIAAGLFSSHPTQAAAWADFNNDGWLDLYIGNELSNRWLSAWQQSSAAGDDKDHPSQLFMNNGDGTFTDVAPRLGLDIEHFVKGVAWGDANNDGLPDLYISVMGGPNRFYLNRGGVSIDDWQFDEIGGELGVHGPFFSFPVWFWDYNNDGWLDLLAGNSDLRHLDDAAADLAREYLGLPFQTEMPRLYRNDGVTGDGLPAFTDVTEEAGLDYLLYAMGANFGDLNNDGFEDAYFGTGAPDFRSLVPNRMFLNQNGHSFAEVTLDGGFGHIQKGHGIAFGDLDRDGDQDVYAVMGGAYEGDVFQDALFENPGMPDQPAWVTLQLRGSTANRAAIGARIAVTVNRPDGSRRQIHRVVSTGGSFGSGSLQQEIGLGDATSIQDVEIVWPDRQQTTEVHRDLEPRRHYLIQQGHPPVPLNHGPVPFNKMEHSAHAHGS